MYTGFTTNIEERIKNHNDGKTKSTAPRRPLGLVRFDRIGSHLHRNLQKGCGNAASVLILALVLVAE